MMFVFWTTSLLSYLIVSIASMSITQDDQTIYFPNDMPEKTVLQRETYSEPFLAELKSFKDANKDTQVLKRFNNVAISRSPRFKKGIFSTRHIDKPFTSEDQMTRTKEDEIQYVNKICEPQVLVTVNRRGVIAAYDDNTPYERQVILRSILQNLMKRKFQSWGGKRSLNPPLRNKRSSFSVWGGTRQNKLASEFSYQDSIPEASMMPLSQPKRPAFNAWGGKRFSPPSSEKMSRLNWWGSVQQGPLNTEKRSPAILDEDVIGTMTFDKKNFHAWGGKRSFPFIRKRRLSFHACGGERFSTAPLEAGLSLEKRSAFQPWGGKRDIAELVSRYRPLDNPEFSEDVRDQSSVTQVSGNKKQLDQTDKNLFLQDNDLMRKHKHPSDGKRSGSQRTCVDPA